MSATCFLHQDGPLPEDAPGRRDVGRRRALAALLLGAALAGGVIIAAARDRAVPAQKPGPRRYPPAYRAGTGQPL